MSNADPGWSGRHWQISPGVAGCLHDLIHQYAAEKLAERQDQQLSTRTSHSCYYLALGKYEQGETHLLRSLQIARQSQIAPLMLDALVGLGIIQAREGAVDQATDLLAGIIRHPAGTSMVKEHVNLVLTDLGYSPESQQKLLGCALDVLPKALTDDVLEPGRLFAQS